MKIHRQITEKAISKNLVTSILEKYACYNQNNLKIAYEALLYGSTLPDVDKRTFTTFKGWHGIRRNNKKAYQIIEEQYLQADSLLLEKNIEEAFICLGTALHTIQDTPAHYMVVTAPLGLPWHWHKWPRNHCDDMEWDYNSKTRKWTKIASSDIYTNPRLKAAIDLSIVYLTSFYEAKNSNFPKNNLSFPS